MSSRAPFALAPGLAANLLILALLAFAGGLATLAPDHYYRAAQEDSFIEWASFWAFALAGMVFLFAVPRPRRAAARLPWFTLCVGAFCVLVALEEISWGQRLIGYRPAAFFLEHNYQQELNLHNVLPKAFRQLAVELVILVFGLLLPLAMQFRVTGDRLEQWGVRAPPSVLTHAFAAMLLLYIWYPWDFTGEWVELALGFGFLFAAIAASQERPVPRSKRGTLTIFGSWLLVLVLGAGTTVAQGGRASDDPARLASARLELETLSVEIAKLLPKRDCGVHKRLYTFVRTGRQHPIRDERSATLAALGVPSARAAYLLDPWNSPYWVRDVCAASPNGERLAFLYSFGPNRRRESTERGIAGDDIGIVLANSDGNR